MHQMDTGHKGTCSTSSPGSVQVSADVKEAELVSTCHQHTNVPELTGSPVRDDEEGDKSQEQDESIMLSPDRLSDEVTKVLNDMNEIVMGIHDIMDDDNDLDSLIQEYSHVEPSEKDYSRETYVQSLNDSFEIDDDKVSGSLVELLETYGKVYEKSVSTERELEEKKNELEVMKKKYDALVQDKQLADEEIEEVKIQLKDLKVAHDEKDMEIVLLKMDLAEREQVSRQVEVPCRTSDAVSDSVHIDLTEENEKGEIVVQEMEFIKNEVKQVKQLLLGQLANDSVAASLNDTTTSQLPIPHNFETPRIDTTETASHLPIPHNLETPRIDTTESIMGIEDDEQPMMKQLNSRR